MEHLAARKVLPVAIFIRVGAASIDLLGIAGIAGSKHWQNGATSTLDNDLIE